VVTVLANDPRSTGPPAEWDAECGFATAGEATRARREEDRRACALVGATPLWLPFGDEEYGRGASDEEIRAELAEAARGAESVLVPGFPLLHADHAWLTALVLEEPEAFPAARIGLYVEQPYAAWRHLGRGRRSWAAEGLTLRKGLSNLARMSLRTPRGRAMQRPLVPEPTAALLDSQPTWLPLRRRPVDWLAKQRAVRAYRSQLRGFGTQAPGVMALYEAAFGGEAIAWTAAGDGRQRRRNSRRV
jgi:LmbE family N-acetylglucosaminyl deacetylase